MKRLHRHDLFCWSTFNERLDIDFNSFAWMAPSGVVLVDPLPLSSHDREQLRAAGGVSWIAVTNSNHLRDARQIASDFGAKLAGPAAERHSFPLPCERWLADGDELVPGLRVIELNGSKTPGELALLLEETTLIAGDLLRAHRADQLMLLLPQQGLKSEPEALASVQRLAALPIEHVLVGDGWCLFGEGSRRLQALAGFSQGQRQLAQAPG